MNTVSAHGGLIHVILFVSSMTGEGVTTTFIGLLYEKGKEIYFDSLHASLSITFAHINLFTSGFCLIKKEDISIVPEQVDDWIQNTDLVSLWPTESR